MEQKLLDIFELERALTPAERLRMMGPKRKTTMPRGHAAHPGTGPQGETCGSCKHLTRRHYSRTYLKCGLMERYWTGGPGTDVRAKDPACRRWEKP